MELKAFCRKQENSLLALAMTGILAAFLLCRFDFYYDLNDDVLIKDILAGVYSGSPDGHTMQLLYPLGLLLSLLYRVLDIPVFGVFLVLCQFGSIYAVAYRTLQCCRKRFQKALGVITESIFFLAVCGEHLVYLQYTVTAGMLAAAAIFWVASGGAVAKASADGAAAKVPADGAAAKASAGRAALGFLRENLPALALYWLAFCLRTEMGLLLLPLAGVAGLCLWGREASIFTKDNFAKYLTTFGTLALGMLLLWGMDGLAYRKDGWPAFRQFFDARTELYDYQRDFAENYEENAADYEALGVTRQQQALLENYNFGADDSIDGGLMGQLSQKAVDRPQNGGLFKKSLREVLSECKSHWMEKNDFPYNFVMLACGLVLFGLGFVRGRHGLLWQVPMCFAAGGVLWLFLLLRDRPVDRVLHPLYLGQAALFAGLLLLEQARDLEGEPEESAGGYRRPNFRHVVRRNPGWTALILAAALSVFFCLTQMPVTLIKIRQESARREEVNRVSGAVMEYCDKNPNILYLEDVYSTVAFSEKITVDDAKPFNYDLLGGWLVKSPLSGKKLAAFGYSSMGEAVRGGRNVQLLTESGTDFAWLSDYFDSVQEDYDIVWVGTIADRVDIYQVVPGSGTESIGAGE